MRQEGSLIDNPKQAKTKQQLAKYVLTNDPNKAAISRENVETDAVGPYDITTRCGTCGVYSYTPIDRLDGVYDELYKKVVHCDCGATSLATSSITNCSNPLTEEFRNEALLNG